MFTPLVVIIRDVSTPDQGKIRGGETQAISITKKSTRPGESTGASAKLRWSVFGMFAIATLSTAILLFAHHGMHVTPPLGERADLRSACVFWSSWHPKEKWHSKEQWHSKEPLIRRSLRGDGGIGASGAATYGFRAGFPEDGDVTRQTAVRAPLLGRQELRSRVAWQDGGFDDNNDDVVSNGTQ